MGKGRDKRRKHEDPAKAARRAARQASKALKHDGKKAAGSGEAASADAEQQLSYSSTARTPAAMLHGFNNEEAIETTLKRIQKAQSKCKTIEERANVPPPSPRVNAVLLPHPDRPHELLLFGGEYWDGATTTAYNDTYFYHLKRRTWSQLVSAVQPPPRSSAQAVTYKHYVVLFGGEFVSQSQSQYLHFRDVWRYDARRSEWSEVKPAKSLTLSSHGNSVSVGSGASGPSARSGHRMVLWRRQAVLFGGFYDNAQECHYYNDLWLLSSLDAVVQWTRVTTQATTTAATAAATAGDAAPHPRSGHGMAVYKDTLFVYGGYSTERFNRFKKSEATVHHDLWMLQLPTTTTTASGSAATATEQGQRDGAEDGGGGSSAVAAHGRTRAAGGGVHAVWVKVRLGGVPPPIRAGVAVAFRDKRMYLFGGVVDIESPGGKLVSTFYNDLFVFHMDSRRFYPVVLRPSTRRGKANATATVTATTSTASRHGQRQNNVSDDDDDDNTRSGCAGTMTTRRGGVDNLAAELAALQLQPARTQQQQQHKSNSSSTGHNSDDDSNDDDDDTDGGVVQASETMKVSYEVRRGGVVYPHRRMDAAVAIVDNTLYVYGGQFESGEREVTMSDLFALHLGRLDGYEVLLSQDLSAAVWLGPGDDDADGAASNSWESGSTVVSAAFDVMDNDDDEDDDDEDDDNANATAAKATAADIRRALQTGGGGGKRNDSAAASDDDDNNNNDNNANDDDEAPEAIPAELDMEATPSVIVDAVTHIRGKKGMQQHKARLLAQLSATAAVPTPRQDEAFATFYARTSTFWLRAAQDAGGSDDDDGDNDDVKKTTTTAVVSPQRRREAMAFARRRYAEARELLQQLRLVEEHERAEQEFFRERRLQREREWQAATAAAEDDDDDDDGSDDDDNDDKAERVATHTPPQA